MPRCRDCRWWARENPRDLAGEWREAFDAGYGACGVVGSPPYLNMHHGTPLDPAFLEGGDGAQMELMTLPDFGCVQFEARSE
jgi:hypothetical protein